MTTILIVITIVLSALAGNYWASQTRISGLGFWMILTPILMCGVVGMIAFQAVGTSGLDGLLSGAIGAGSGLYFDRNVR
ncbi:MAG: hypothetical protein SGJ27_27220 [Candidatus Melainabacteria bacterium]|nr:hypothetical protein [Candidatus Melainabacteria bacterium]